MTTASRLTRLLTLGLGLVGCRSAPAFPLVWELGAVATKGGVEVPVRVLSAPSRRGETVSDGRVTFSVLIDTAEVEAGGVRGSAPVRVEVSPTTVPAGLAVSRRHVGGLEVGSAPADFTQSVELATTDATGAELARTQVVTTATGAPRALPLRPFGK